MPTQVCSFTMQILTVSSHVLDNLSEFKKLRKYLSPQLKKMEESHQEATEKEVERILAWLRGYFADDCKHVTLQIK